MGIDLLRDLALAGVKWELDDTPKSVERKVKNVNNNAKAQSAAPLRPTLCTLNSAPISVPASAPIGFNTAETAIAGINDIDSLCNIIKDFNHPLKMFAKNTVLPQIGDKIQMIGDRLLVITDSPSSDDDETGKILSGAAGELFDKMISAIGLSRENITICPLVFWRTPGGRTPTDEELEIARPFVSRLIELLQPMAILTLGTLAAQQLKTNDYRLTTISIPHPNYLMLKPDSKKATWEELQKLEKILQNEPNKV